MIFSENRCPLFGIMLAVLFVTIEMRHAPFYGWIRDLSAPDPTNLFNLFGLIPLDPTILPVVGPFLHHQRVHARLRRAMASGRS